MQPHNGAEQHSSHTWRVLFVCGGNTCRSPMAKAIAERELNGRFPFRGEDVAAKFTCAGTDAVREGSGASQHAQAALFRLDKSYAKCLKGMKSEAVSQSLLEQTDLLIALDTDVARAIRRHYRIEGPDRLLLWRVRDPWPYRHKKTAYNRARNEILKHICSLKTKRRAKPTSASLVKCRRPRAIMREVQTLRKSVAYELNDRLLKRYRAMEVVGIVVTLHARFEKLLRRMVVDQGASVDDARGIETLLQKLAVARGEDENVYKSHHTIGQVTGLRNKVAHAEVFAGKAFARRVRTTVMNALGSAELVKGIQKIDSRSTAPKAAALEGGF
jgi:protein-tyrosine-phosphatase